MMLLAQVDWQNVEAILAIAGVVFIGVQGGSKLKQQAAELDATPGQSAGGNVVVKPNGGSLPDPITSTVRVAVATDEPSIQIQGLNEQASDVLPITLGTDVAQNYPNAIVVRDSGDIQRFSVDGHGGGGIQLDNVNGATFSFTTAPGGNDILRISSQTEIGFFGAGPVAQQAGAGVTTVAELVAILQAYGLLS